MICEDSLCQQLNTCKWDSPVSSVFCGNMYAPAKPEPVIQESKYDISDKLRNLEDTISLLTDQLEDAVANISKPKENGYQPSKPTNRRYDFE
mgnify:CR=1 FL=1